MCNMDNDYLNIIAIGHVDSCTYFWIDGCQIIYNLSVTLLGIAAFLDSWLSLEIVVKYGAIWFAICYV